MVSIENQSADLEISVPDKSDCAHQSPPLNWINKINVGAYIINLVITYVSITGAFGDTNTDLSKKYQTLVTPAGWAFSIWGPIFIWEGVFTVAQLVPKYRASKVLPAIAPFWWAACIFQIGWSLVFAQDLVALALVLMLCILASLLGVLWRRDAVEIDSFAEYWLLRAPFSLHAGWIIAASAVNTNVLADCLRSPPATLLGFAVVSFAVVFASATFFALAIPKPDGIICFVAFWALMGVSSELNNAEGLLDEKKRHNFFAWDRMVLDGLGSAAQVLSFGSLGLAVLAVTLRIRRGAMANCLKA